MKIDKYNKLIQNLRIGFYKDLNNIAGRLASAEADVHNKKQ